MIMPAPMERLVELQHALTKRHFVLHPSKENSGENRLLRIALFALGEIRIRLEARGVEPLSSSPSAQTSTCLSDDKF